MREIVIASGNRGKVREIVHLLDHLDVQILSLDDFENAPAVNEDQPTLEGNSIKKAREMAAFTSLPVIADDTGLEVEYLNGEPGVFSARFAGPESDASANRTLLLSQLEGVTDRSARFRTVATFIDEHGDVHIFEGVCNGSIARTEKGSEGFGYDSIFIPEGSDRTFAEMTDLEKNQISHRARALEGLVNHLEIELSRNP